MITVILDTNVFVRAAIRPSSQSARIVDAYLDGKFQLIHSQPVLEELLAGLLFPAIRRYHAWSDEEVLEFVTNLPAAAWLYPGIAPVAPSIPRDVSDVKFLSLAQESGAMYLVTKDGRHLLRLKRFGPTRIVTPRQFLGLLSNS